jgi:Cu(I)/Ag(I) efflux system membrane fusion protein
MTANDQVQSKGYGAILLGLALGIAIASLGYYWFFNNTQPAAGKIDQPLYWVAPMDANFRRDAPGKSPMGMDLVPVYASNNNATTEGMVSVSPAVVNSLGVRLTQVVKEPLVADIRTVGYIKYNEDLLVHIHPRVEGWIEKLYVKSAGDPVSADQPLYALYSPELVNAQEEYLLALQRNNATLVDAARQRLLSLQIPTAVIKELNKTRKVKSTTTFFSPQQGVVDNLEVREGFYVKPGTNLMTIGALDEIWVEAEVFERQASLIETGASVIMTLDYLPGRQWQGKIDYIYPTLDPVTRTLRLRLVFSNADHALKPNMFAEISINSTATPPTLLIPSEALIRTGSSDRVVRAFGNGQFHSVEVRTGRISGQQIEILDGLLEGQSIVSSGQFLLDSESSKTADLQRLDAGSNDQQTVTPPADNDGPMSHAGHDMAMPPAEDEQPMPDAGHNMVMPPAESKQPMSHAGHNMVMPPAEDKQPMSHAEHDMESHQ